MLRISPLLPGTVFFALLFPAFLIFGSTVSDTVANARTETVKIGFLVPMPLEKDDLSREAFYGAQLAVEEANKKGGYSGTPFEMITLSTDGPWGSGSKRAVKLVYEDQVSGMVTSLDGRNAHLAEQVITKARVALIVTRATDPTITKAFVPWVFRILPNDEQQARFLTKEIYPSGKLQKVLVLTTDSYDSKGGAGAFFKIAQANSYPEPTQILLNTVKPDHQLPDKIQSMRPDAIIIFSLPDEALHILKEIGLKVPVFGPVSLLYDHTLMRKRKTTGKDIHVISPGFMLTEKGKIFQSSYKKRYGFLPGAVAANAYEGMRMMMLAIVENGPDRDRIREYLTNIKTYQGINGVIDFDDHGNLKSWQGFFKIIR